MARVVGFLCSEASGWITGQVIVADGTEAAAKRLKNVLTNDPMMGVIRHVDAGYEEAEACAQTQRVPIPMRDA